MQLEDYTAEAICRAMNLPGFVEPAWTKRELPTLRILLKPSFHPEVCITIESSENCALASVIVLAEQFWERGPAAAISGSCEEFSVSSEKFEEWVGLFKKASSPEGTNERVAYLDGMSLECCLASQNSVERFRAHASEPANESFLIGILEVAWNSCAESRVRNGLSAAGVYLGLRFPGQEVPPEPPTSLIAVMGTPEGRKEFFEMLERVKKSKSKK